MPPKRVPTCTTNPVCCVQLKPGQRSRQQWGPQAQEQQQQKPAPQWPQKQHCKPAQQPPEHKPQQPLTAPLPTTSPNGNFPLDLPLRPNKPRPYHHPRDPTTQQTRGHCPLIHRDKSPCIMIRQPTLCTHPQRRSPAQRTPHQNRLNNKESTTSLRATTAIAGSTKTVRSTVP